jgi:hypothetical protein
MGEFVKANMVSSFKLKGLSAGTRCDEIGQLLLPTVQRQHMGLAA